MKYIYIIFFILIISKLHASDNFEIIIIDKQSGKPLSSATVRFICYEGNCKGKIISLKSDKEGKIVSPFDGKQEIFVKFIGYEEFIYEVEPSKSPLKIELNPTSIFLDEIVTTGQFVPRKIEKSIYPIEIISAERIDAQNAINLRDVLQTQMNYRISNDSFLGSALQINGVSGRNVKILIDGVPVIGRQNGNIDISQLNLNNAKKIEIIEGPMSTMYGTDALGGVINIITEDNITDNFKANANSYYESIGTYNFDGNLHYSKGKNSFRLTGGRNFFGGYDIVDTSRSVQWKPKEQYFADLDLSRSFKAGRLRYSADVFSELLLNRGGLRPPFFTDAFDEEYQTNRLTNSLFYNRKINSNYIDLTVAYSYYEREKYSYLKDLTDLSEVPIVGAQDTTAFKNFMARGSYLKEEATDWLSIQAGFEINADNITGGRIEDSDKSVEDYAVFASMQLEPIEDLTIQPSARFIYNTMYDAPIVPALHLKYSPHANLIFRASYARGFRSPSLRELYFFFVDINHNVRGNENLNAETSHSFNLATDWKRISKYNVIKAELNSFYNDIDDLISLANIEGDLFSYVNIGKFRTLGGNVSLSYLLDELTLKMGASYIGNSTERFSQGGTNEFFFSPEFTGNIMYKIPNTEFSAALFYKYTGRREAFSVDETGEVTTFEIGGFGIMDITFSYSFFDKSIEVNGGLKNALDVVNVDRSTPVGGGVHSDGSLNEPIGWGRTFFLGINYNYKKN